MTDTADHIEEREPDQAPKRETLWITDAELIRRIGVPEKIGYQRISYLDARKDSGFPQKQQSWGNRRYWPAVKAYFELNYGLKMNAPYLRRAS